MSAERSPIVAGIIGGIIGAILMDVILVGSKILLGLPALADFMVMGTSIGFSGGLAIPAGFIAHHIVGAAWGAVIGYIAAASGILERSISWVYSVGYGSMAGIIIYAIFFTPILIFIFRPVMAGMMGEEAAAQMMPIVAGLGFTEHIIFGAATALTISYYSGR